MSSEKMSANQYKISRMPFVLWVEYMKHKETHDGHCLYHGKIEIAEKTKVKKYQVPLCITPDDVNLDGTLKGHDTIPKFNKCGGCGGGSGYCGAESYYTVIEVRIKHVGDYFVHAEFARIHSKCVDEYNQVVSRVESIVGRLEADRKAYFDDQRAQVDKHNSRIRTELNRLAQQYGRGNVPRHLYGELKKQFKTPRFASYGATKVATLVSLDNQRRFLVDYYQGNRLYQTNDRRCHNDNTISDSEVHTGGEVRVASGTETRVWCMFYYSCDPKDLPPTWTSPAPQAAGFYGYWCKQQ